VARNLDTVDVVGHSFGGVVPQANLLEYPDRIRWLVLISAGGLGQEIALALRLASSPGVVAWLGQPFMGPGTRLALKATGHMLSQNEVATLTAMNARSGSARAFARTASGIIDWRGQRHTLFKRASEVPRLPSVAVFWGDRHPIIPASDAQALADRLEGVRVRLSDGCGHNPYHEQPAAFAKDDAAAANCLFPLMQRNFFVAKHWRVLGARARRLPREEAVKRGANVPRLEPHFTQKRRSQENSSN
jgi:pimeloyl-ACP methyl ester carboxylesterase